MIQTNEFYSETAAWVQGIPNATWAIVIGFFAVLFVVNKISRSNSLLRRTYYSGHPRGNLRVAPAASVKTPSHTTLTASPPNLSDPKQQMEAIAYVDFEITPLLNREEARLLPLLESCTRKLNKGHRVMAQTSLGEIIRPKQAGLSQDQQRAAFASINSKRRDFAIFDRFGRLAIAIEYQGSGHYQAKSFMRDAVKREVLRKAGVPYVEVKRDFSHDDVAREITQLLNPPEQVDNVTTLRPS